MNWKKRKKLCKIAHAHGKSHYYEWRSVIKALCHLDLYMTYSKEKRSEAWRVLAGKKVERNHPTDTVKVEVTVQEFNKPNRMKRQYDPDGISDVDVGRIVGGEAIEYPNSAVIDLRNTTIAPRVSVSSEGVMKFDGFDLCKT